MIWPDGKAFDTVAERKRIKFEHAQETAFEQLKRALTEELVLNLYCTEAPHRCLYGRSHSNTEKF